jgi:hypothetical protein
MKTLAARVAYLVAVGVGAASWMYVAQLGGRREAWDSDLYYTVALPAAAVVAVVLGFLVPEKPWRWGFAPFGGQAAAALVQNPTGSLLPLGLILFAILGGLCTIPAYAGASIGRLVRRKATT